jgi:hypothetical protein
MTALSALWLPILLATVIVFIASAIIHMAPLWHRTDFPQLANERQVLEALRPLAIPVGDYLMPRPSGGEDARSAQFQERLRQGPVVLFTMLPAGGSSMGRSLALWFVYVLAMAFFAAYVASRALPAGVLYLKVFQLVGATAFIGFAAALWQMSIWYRRSWSLTLKATLDGLIYAALMGGTFGWLWPR